MEKKCLNGWWDFLPIYDDDNGSDHIPEEGWLHNAYLVPSVWRKPLEAVRHKGEEYYKTLDINDFNKSTDWEFLYDDYNYPVEWTKTKSAWARTYFNISEVKTDKRYFIRLDAVMPMSRIYINGTYMHDFVHPTLPDQIDVTEYIQKGKNELCVFIHDYENDEYGRAKVPTGTMLIAYNAGIWQNVFLETYDDLRISDVTVTTSYREKKISAEYEISNDSQVDKDVRLKCYIIEYKGKNTTNHIIDFNYSNTTVQSCKSEIARIETKWDKPHLWDTSDPFLYYIVCELWVENKLSDTYKERFGFREVWIEGKNLMFNGYPLHLFSDWGHKVSTYCFTDKWIKKWFKMIRDCNMNHTRLHTSPHPEILCELADEYGILVTGETGLHGAGGSQASNDDEYWENSKDHVTRFVRRDKNHPCVIMWSVENEMRWNQKGDEQKYAKKTLENLPILRKLFNTLDPTRPAYHEGDSSLWDESSQDILSRHYGKDGVGADWWNEKQPLHNGEMSLYHYESSNTALSIFGEKVYEDFKVVDEASALDTKWLVEYGRTKGVCCFGPWNQSCLKLIRNCDHEILLNYEDFTKEGIKPLYVRPYTSEFNFWEEGKGYDTLRSFDIQKDGFRPFALIDHSNQINYYDGKPIVRKICAVNDTYHDVEGELCVYFNNTLVKKEKLSVKRGYTVNVDVDLLPSFINIRNIQNYSYRYEFMCDGKVLDKQFKEIRIYPKMNKKIDRLRKISSSYNICILKPKKIAELFDQYKIRYGSISDTEKDISENVDLLIVESDIINEGSHINKVIDKYVSDGGKVILMEQNTSMFKGLNMIQKNVLTTFCIADNQIFNNISSDDLCYWGIDSYAKINSNAIVARSMYVKSDIPDDITYLLESGEGGFGRGDLENSTLLMIKHKKGLIIANQMLISEKWKDQPSARELIFNIFLYAYSYVNNDVVNRPIILNGSDHEMFERYERQLSRGGRMIISGLNKNNVEKWNILLHSQLKVEEKTVYQGIKNIKDIITQGISNDDMNGIVTFSYCKPTAHNTVIADNVIEDNGSVKPIISTCENNIMKELSVFDGQTELRRAFTITKYYHNVQRDSNILIGSVKYADGIIYLNQLIASDKNTKFERLQNRLYYNLGAESVSTILTDETVHCNRQSNGYPERMHIQSFDINDDIWNDFVSTTVNNNERMPHKKTISIGEWSVNESSMIVHKETDRKCILLTFNIFSSEPRKNIETNLGVPNPELLTFVDFFGKGDIRLAVNGTDMGRKAFTDGMTSFSDISLESRHNYVMIAWCAKAIDDELNMQWHDINGRAEVNFEFYI